MTDAVFLLTIVVFFAVASLFVSACGRIVGADETAPADAADRPVEATR